LPVMLSFTVLWFISTFAVHDAPLRWLMR
jgi:hypothetical protein